jgi:hypothetical protein
VWFPKRFGCVEEWIAIVVAEHLNNTCDRHVPT